MTTRIRVTRRDINGREPFLRVSRILEVDQVSRIVTNRRTGGIDEILN